MTDEELKEKLAQAIRNMLTSIQWDYEGEQEEEIQGIVKAISDMIDKKIAHEIFSLVNND